MRSSSYDHSTQNQVKNKLSSATVNARTPPDGKTTPLPEMCQLCLIFLNTRSTVNKINGLEVLLFFYDPRLPVISETWLHSSTPEKKNLPTDYVIYRRDRGSCGGGVVTVK